MRSVSRWHLCLLLGLAALAIAGCEGAPTVRLLDVDTVGPARIDPGHRLVIEGDGFAVGHDARVALIGVLCRPFEPDEAIDESFPAETISERRVELLVTETLLRERFGRATFRGAVEVRFDARWEDRAGTISGGLDELEIDFVPTHGASARGMTLGDALGVTFLDSPEDGLAVDRVDPEGRGASLGLSAGDRLTALGSARLLPGDRPIVPDHVEDSSLTIVREGRSSMLRLDLGEHGDSEDVGELVRLAQLAFVIVLVGLLGAWPLSSTDVAPARAPRGLSRPTLAIVARALAGLVLAHAALLAIDHLPPVGLVIACIVGLRAATTMAGSERPFAQWLPVCVSSIALAVALASIPAALDIGDVRLLAESGSAAPLGWPLFREPVGVLSLVLLALAAGVAPKRRVAVFADDVWLFAVALLVVLAGTGLSPVDRTGTFALDVAVVACAWMLGRARAHVRPSPMSLGLALALSAVVVLLLGAWVALEPSAQLRHAFAEVSFVAVVLTVIFALRAAVRERPAQRPQHALL